MIIIRYLMVFLRFDGLFMIFLEAQGFFFGLSHTLLSRYLCISSYPFYILTLFLL